MKEYRKFIHDPPFKQITLPDEIINARSICLIPYRQFNKYFITIGIEEVYSIDGKSFNRGHTLQQIQIIGNTNSKLHITIRGIVNGNITGDISETLMLDVFVNMVLDKHPEWVNEYFPDWDYVTEFKLKLLNDENVEDNVMSDETEIEEEPLKNMSLRVIKGGLCSKE